MFIFTFNLFWMSYNMLLGSLALIFGLISYRSSSKKIRIVSLLLWFLFLPNTIYVLTDINHLKRQLSFISAPGILLGLFSQYIVFFIAGTVLFVYCLHLLERILKEEKYITKRNRVPFYFLFTVLNFMVAFGVVMGRVQRTNSWYILTHTERVINDVYKTLTSPDLFLYTILLGILTNILYFSLRPFIAQGILKRK